MILIPYEAFTIVTSTSALELSQLLQRHVEPPRRYRFVCARDRKQFQGTVTDSDFTLSRIINYRNSFLPAIHGRFEDGLGETRVVVRMFPHITVIVFMVFWLVFFGNLILFIMRDTAQSQSWLDGGLPIPVVFLAFTWLMMWGGFWFEARKARQMLTQILA